MNLWQVGLQLGIAGIIVVAGYLIAVLLIKKWQEEQIANRKAQAEADAARTRAIADGFAAIVGRLDSDLESHRAMTAEIARFSGRLDVLADLKEATPVQVPIPKSPPRAYERAPTPSPAGRERVALPILLPAPAGPGKKG